VIAFLDAIGLKANKRKMGSASVNDPTAFIPRFSGIRGQYPWAGTVLTPLGQYPWGRQVPAPFHIPWSLLD
jgi:hypothetical protein